MDVIDWLLEEDNPSARYLTLRHLEGRPEDDPAVAAARAAIAGSPPARAILDAQWPAGYWMHPDVGYSPRHRATAWQVVFLAALGAPLIPAIDRACAFLLAHSRLPDGCFTAYAADLTRPGSPRGTFLCLNGSLVRALFELDYVDSRREESTEALAELLLGGAPRCEVCAQEAAGASAKQPTAPPCVHGTVKALDALARVPRAQRSSRVQAAVEKGVALLTSKNEATTLLTDPGTGEHAFGFPPDERTDVPEALLALAAAGAPPSPAVEAALAIVRDKQRSDGTWALDHTPENTWATFGTIGRPNKWVTLRALHTLHLWSSA
ncbi:MAG: hypothetical protein P8129_11035 [Anaerolineae bacterium]